MLALGCDEIVMGKHSQLGPIDPQFTLTTPQGTRQAPAAEILRQFERAKREIAADPKTLPAWAPLLAGVGPGLLSQCVTATQRSQEIVCEWLKRYMLRDDPERDEKARRAAEDFGDYERHESHNNPIMIAQIEELGLAVSPLEADQTYQDLVLSIFHATMISLNAGIQKIIENHAGAAFIRNMSVPAPPVLLAPPTPVPQPFPFPRPPGQIADPNAG
jgi:hypothetical protein